jgi:hypothetical protein
LQRGNAENDPVHATPQCKAGIFTLTLRVRHQSLGSRA